jgi:CubicO group peptidase (beta-lactamase class C family)
VSGWYPTALAAHLERTVDDGILCVGVQLSVSHGGVTHELCFGSAGPDAGCSADTIWRLFCAAKPAAAVTVAALAAAGRIDLDGPVGDQLSAAQLPTGPLAAGHVTVRQLLDHTAGLHQLHGYGVGALPADVRHRMVAELAPPPSWDPDRHAGYSEYAAWHLLGLLIEAVTDQPAGAVLASTVGEPMCGGELWFAMSDQQYRELYGRLGVGYDLREPDPTPLLANRNRRPCTDLNVAYGGYGTARGLRRFYETMLAVLRGEDRFPFDPATAAAVVGHRRGRRPDVVLRRPCDFGLGVMVDLADHGFEPWVSAEAFGHTGFFGTSLGLADPVHDLALGVVWNGIVDGDLGVRTRRNAVLRALGQDLGLDPHPGSTHVRGRGRP